MIYLSYLLDSHTPTYRNQNKFKQIKKSDIIKGDVANNTIITTTVHIGTHIDMPYHFYINGQTIEDFDANFWVYKQEEILFVELKMHSGDVIIKDKLIDQLEEIKNNSKLKTNKLKLLLVKTGICNRRHSEEFWSKNYGFHPAIANYLRVNFPGIRVMGFDSISVSSFLERKIGREAHRCFLDPKNPILLLEDMDLTKVDKNTNFKEILISPLRIAQCDGLPCTVFGVLDD